ncbi:hypothetical protein ACTWKC_18225 [Bacillus sp. 4A_MP3]
MIKRYTCQNGVRVVLENNPTVRSVAIGVWIGTGHVMKRRRQTVFRTFLSICFLKEQIPGPHGKSQNPSIG